MTDLETLRRALREEESACHGEEPLDVGAVITRGRRLRWRRRAVAVAGGVCAVAAVFGVVTGISQLTGQSPGPAPYPVSPAHHPASPAPSVPGPSPSRAPGQPSPSQSSPVPARTGTPAPTPTPVPTSAGSAGRPPMVTPSASLTATLGTSAPRDAIPSPTASR
jgi:hypothetical protein